MVISESYSVFSESLSNGGRRKRQLYFFFFFFAYSSIKGLSRLKSKKSGE